MLAAFLMTVDGVGGIAADFSWKRLRDLPWVRNLLGYSWKCFIYFHRITCLSQLLAQHSAPGSEVTILQYLKGRAEDNEYPLFGSGIPASGVHDGTLKTAHLADLFLPPSLHMSAEQWHAVADTL